MKNLLSLLILLQLVGCTLTSPQQESVTLPGTSAPVQSPSPKVTTQKHVTVISPSPSRTVYLTGEIGAEASLVAEQIKELGASSREPMYLIIHSPGGRVLDGALIASAMEASKAPVKTVCVQLCASMAAVIFEYGQERLIVDRAFLMFHPASGGAQGELDKMVSRLSSVKRFVGKMDQHIASRAGLTLQQFKAEASEELWIDGEDAVNRKFADKLVSVNVKANPKPLPFIIPEEKTPKKPLIELVW